ncbi:MAG: UDP-glucose/GDP-mannose dehydrogenase family protein, partial [Acidobacteriota bacterium]|nr:UDP-glucose/GDP-mannose dehydrogenase family protein [Acidobacteriota bacterium]
ETSIRVAEMVKYASNAFHAVKVCFANEMGTLAKKLEVDAGAVTDIFASDTRLNISTAYLSPGFSFGGSCLPKDVRALANCAQEHGLRLPMMESVLRSNQEHLERVVEMALRDGKKKICLLGLSFKAGTDDLRESPHVELVKRLLSQGCTLTIWDPSVVPGRLAGANRQFIEGAISYIGALLRQDLKEAVEAAEVVIVGTKEAKRESLDQCLRPEQIVIDLVNLKKKLRPQAGSQYEGICW